MKTVQSNVLLLDHNDLPTESKWKDGLVKKESEVELADFFHLKQEIKNNDIVIYIHKEGLRKTLKIRY